jgi:hypothetical protein
MKSAFLTLLLIPFLSFGQVSKKEKKSIDKYALSMCECVNDLMSELHPKTIEVVMLMAEKGQEDAMKDVEAMLTEMTPEEMQEFLASFTTMESEEFLQKIEDCDGSDSLDPEMKEQIDNAEGDAHAYLMEVLGREEACKVMKSLYDLGAGASE